jgi:Fe-S cluster biogenesis protein NfuA
MDGGDIELVDVAEGIVKLRLVGIERAIRAEVPEIKGVEAVDV